LSLCASGGVYWADLEIDALVSVELHVCDQPLRHIRGGNAYLVYAGRNIYEAILSAHISFGERRLELGGRVLQPDVGAFDRLTVGPTDLPFQSRTVDCDSNVAQRKTNDRQHSLPAIQHRQRLKPQDAVEQLQNR